MQEQAVSSNSLQASLKDLLNCVMQILNFLEHQNDSARNIPRRELGKLIYGNDSVYARTPTPEQVKAAAFPQEAYKACAVDQGILGEADPSLELKPSACFWVLA